MIPTEEAEQIAVVQYLELLGAKYSSIPNSTYTKSWSQKRKNTATGLRAGFPDLVVILNNKFFTIEMKRLKRGVVSAEQKSWHEALNAAGVPSYVCCGFEQAKKVIDTYR